MGRKPLPRAVRFRPLVFLLGPPGVGKSTVARRLVGEQAPHLHTRALLDALAWRIRRRQWPAELDQLPVLIVDGPCFLPRRPGVAAGVQSLLQVRVERGLKTVVTDAEGGAVVHYLMEGISPDARATVVLRFPVGRGRTRYAQRLCEELGLPRALAAEVGNIEPWSYDAVRQALCDRVHHRCAGATDARGATDV